MENGGGAKPTTRFGFSWADEVEREEREQVAMQQQEEEAAKREQIKAKANPFGAARPREVVLAEKGVDWRARDRELDLGTAPRPPRSAARGHRRTTATVAASACAATPARGMLPLDRDAGRTPHPRRQAPAAASAPRPPPTGRRNETPVGRSARGGSKRKFAGDGPVRRAPPVGDHAEQGRRVFGELNVSNGYGSSICGYAAWNGCNCNPGGGQAGGMKAAGAVAADGAPSDAVTATGLDESAAGQKRSRGGKGRKKGMGSGKAKKQQALLI